MNLKAYTRVCLSVLSILLLLSCQEKAEPEKYARLAAERIIADASFTLAEVPQKAIVFPCIADCTPWGNNGKLSTAYATITADSAGNYRLGFSAGDTYSVQLNGIRIITGTESGKAFPREIAYGTYEFEKYAAVYLKQGVNDIVLNTNGKVSFGAVDPEGFTVPGLQYSIEGYTDPHGNRQTPPTYREKKIAVCEHAKFRKHPYTEWHYANGATMLGILSLADLTGDRAYSDFVDRFCSFTLDNLPVYEEQYYGQNSLYTQNYRYFRRTMLDDSTAPALPFLEKYARGQLPEAKETVENMARYIMDVQFRLEDGTFVRPEPRWTLWADDLFMGVPFLLRYARVTGDERYLDEAVRQIKAYHRYLWDNEKGLYHHGWNATQSRPLGSYWGRANGWIAWAVTEALLELPESHSGYGEVMEVYRRQMQSIIAFQSASGMWHQLLHRDGSYEETSCTALFVLALARGVRNGWLDKSYREQALNGWRAIEKQIDPVTGDVSGICRSTAIGPDEEFYLKQEQRTNDPRGMGAVIMAGVEVARMIARK